VTVEPSTTHQTLLGFGASLAYDDDLIVSQQDKAALYDALFANSGLTMLRLRNRFEGNNLDQLDAAAEIVAEATKRIGHAPTLFMTSGTPPAALKANGRRFCANADADCTLAQAAGGGFDYAGFAEFWRGSLEAYESVGIHPDFVSIQNNPDYIPPDATALEACRFLPVEGTSVVTTPDGQTVTAPFPGYSEALSAVQSAVSSVGDYAFAAAEAGSLVMTSRYEELAPATYQALAYHLYGTQVSDVDLAGLQALRSYGQQTGRPVIQSEMPAPGFDTAVLAHYSLTVADAAAYLQQTLVGSDFGEGAMTLFAIDGKSFARLPAYHALAHFARFTAPGWRRVEAGSDDTHLLVSAWSPPDGSALTVVLINTGSDGEGAEVTVSGNAAALLAKAQVTRTVFDGVERSANLGALSSEHIVRVPGRAIVTVSSKAN